MRCTVFALFAALPAAASAQTVERFRLERTESGFVRMDTQTGVLSTCVETDRQLVCRMAADDRTAWEDESERLRAEVARLQERVDALERRPALALPSDGDIDRTLGVMEKLFRGFAGIAREWGEGGMGNEGGTAPDRT